MIEYKDSIFHIKDNIYYAPYMQTIFETDGTVLDEVDFKQWLRKTIQFEFSVQNIYEPSYSKSAEILVTDRCNLSCRYCYSGGYRSTQTIDKEFAITIVNHLFKNAYHTRLATGKTDTVYILFHGGGEPTQAWDEMLCIVELAKELSKKYNIKVKFNLATNGVFSKLQLNYLLENNFDFRVSLDGVEKINDLTRPMVDMNSSFPIVAENLDAINKSGHKFVIASVVTNENIQHMSSFIDYVIKRWNNVYDLRFFMLEETELTHHNQISLLNLKRFQTNLYNGIKLMISKEIGHYKKYVSLSDYLLRNHKGCCAPSIMQMPVYNSNGDILRCNAHVFDDKAKIGEYENGRLVFDKTKYQHLFEEIKGKTSACDNCLCSTYCEFGGDSCVKPLKATESYCEYMQQYFNELLYDVFVQPELISTSEIIPNNYPGVKRIVHWKI